jgi:UDP-2-acetamido-3-amino-2,3-dideoxy-glucuronate N-acetyltransferase
MALDASVFVHEKALCESTTVCPRTRVWAFAHVMKGAVVGSHCNIGEGAFVEAGAVLGDRVTLKNQVMVWEGVRIGDDVFVGPGVIFTNDRAPRSPRMPEAAARYADKSWCLTTTVEKGASLGAGAVILPGLRIGPYAFVAAGSLVTHDVPAHRLVLGHPARAMGWACACGTRLADDLRCPACGTAHRLEAGVLAAVPDDGTPAAPI